MYKQTPQIIQANIIDNEKYFYTFPVLRKKPEWFHEESKYHFFFLSQDKLNLKVVPLFPSLLDGYCITIN